MELPSGSSPSLKASVEAAPRNKQLEASPATLDTPLKWPPILVPTLSLRKLLKLVWPILAKSGDKELGNVIKSAPKLRVCFVVLYIHNMNTNTKTCPTISHLKKRLNT